VLGCSRADTAHSVLKGTQRYSHGHARGAGRSTLPANQQGYRGVDVTSVIFIAGSIGRTRERRGWWCLSTYAHLHLHLFQCFAMNPHLEFQQNNIYKACSPTPFAGVSTSGTLALENGGEGGRRRFIEKACKEEEEENVSGDDELAVNPY
jgi:hypothetical protein